MPIFDAEAAEGAVNAASATDQALILLLLVMPIAGFLLTALVGRRLGTRPWIIAVAAIIIATWRSRPTSPSRRSPGAYGESGIEFTLYDVDPGRRLPGRRQASSSTT